MLSVDFGADGYVRRHNDPEVRGETYLEMQLIQMCEVLLEALLWLGAFFRRVCHFNFETKPTWSKEKPRKNPRLALGLTL